MNLWVTNHKGGHAVRDWGSMVACKEKYTVTALIACLKEEREKCVRMKRSCTDKVIKKVARSNSRGQKETFSL